MDCECLTTEIKTEKTKKSSSAFTGFILGGMIGAGVALLATPRTGIETRNMLREKSIELKDKAMDTAQETTNRVSDQANQMLNRGQDIYKQQKSSLQGAVEGIREGIRTYKEQGSQPVPLKETPSNVAPDFKNPDIHDTGNVM